MPFAFFRIVFTEAPRGGAGIEIGRRREVVLPVRKPLVEGLVLKFDRA